MLMSSPVSLVTCIKFSAVGLLSFIPNSITENSDLYLKLKLGFCYFKVVRQLR